MHTVAYIVFYQELSVNNFKNSNALGRKLFVGLLLKITCKSCAVHVACMVYEMPKETKRLL